MELSKLQYISQGEDHQSQLRNIKIVLDAGGLWIQVRFKNKPYAKLMKLAEEVRLLCSEYKSIMIVNDDVNVAASCDADGLHLGLDDGKISNARAILGQSKIIGGTANTATHVKQRIAEGCDYIGLGPMRFTTTKAKLSPLLGFNGYRDIFSQPEIALNKTPIYAIGGVDIADVPKLLSFGLHGVAVSGKINFLNNARQSIDDWNRALNLVCQHDLQNKIYIT